MFAARVVEAIDVFEEGDLDIAPGVPVAPPDQFGFRDLKKLSTAELSSQLPLPLIDTLNPFLRRSFWS